MNRYIMSFGNTKIPGLYVSREKFLEALAKHLNSYHFHKPDGQSVEDWMNSFKIEYKGEEFFLGQLLRVALRVHNSNYIACAIVNEEKVVRFVLDLDKINVTDDIPEEMVKFFEPKEIVLNKVKNIPVGEFVDFEEMLKESKLEDKEFKIQIINCLEWKLLDLQYKLHTDEEVVGYNNEWTSDLSLLARNFDLANGTVFNGRDPQCIRIGFKRSAI